MNASKQRVFLADGNHYVHRLHSIVGTKSAVQNLEKTMMTSFLTMVTADAVACQCTGLVVAFDSATSFREKLYPEYKATRKQAKESRKRPHEVTASLDIPEPGSFVSAIKAMLPLAGVKAIQKRGLEGDDILASLVSTLPCKVVIGSRDKDMFQLVEDPRVSMFWPTEKRLMREKDIEKSYGIHPNLVLDFLSISGDGADNIPSVGGLGAEYVKRILRTYGSVKQGMHEDQKFKKAMLKSKAQYLFNRKLVALKHVDLGLTVEDCMLKPYGRETLRSMLWSIPPGLDKLVTAQRGTNIKGLFG